MVATSTVNSVIEAFTNWQQPWVFYPYLIGHANCGEDERKAIEAIWSTACNKEHWLAGTLQESSVRAKQAIAKAFPWLSAGALQQIINGAAYQWR